MFRFPHLIDVDLMEVGESHPSEILDHPEFSEDAMQELALVQHACPAGLKRKEVAEKRLDWLAYELGLTHARPSCRKPELVRTEPARSRRTRVTGFYQELKIALDFERIPA